MSLPGFSSLTRTCSVIALLVACLNLLATAESHSGPQRAAGARKREALPAMGNEQVTNIPYYSLSDGMSSTLTLNNLAPSPTMVKVTLFNSKGIPQILDPIVIDRHSYRQIPLRDVVEGGDFDSGNIKVVYESPLPMAVTCQVSVFSLKSRVSFESREQDMMDFMSTELNGIVPLPKAGVKGFLAVTNTAPTDIAVTSNISSHEETFSLRPRETRLLEVSEGIENQVSPGALIRLRHNGMPGEIITTGFVLGLQDGYSSSFTMFDSAIMASRRLAGVHFLFGQPDTNDGFPVGTYFNAPLLLADVGNKPVKVRVSADYTIHTDDGSGEGKDTPRHIALEELTLIPAGVQQVELSAELRRAGVRGPVKDSGIDITYDARPGSVIAQLTTSDQTGNYSFEVPIKDPAAMNEQMEGDYPWTIGNGNRAVVHFKNTTMNTVNALLVLNFTGGRVYNLPPIVLRPFQSVPFDIQKLKNSKKRDFYGRPFPRDATEGQLQWRQVIPYSMIARLEETNIQQGVAKSFSCGAGCCNYFYENPYVSPTSFTGNVGAGTTLTAWVAGHDCYNNPFSSPATPAYSTTNSSVATVDSAGNVTLVGPGTATINAQFYLHDYYWDIDNRCHIEYYYKTVSVPVTSRPTISGPNRVWWFNGQTVSGYATQITLTTQASGTWAVPAGGSEVHLSSPSGQSINISGTGTFSSSANDVTINVTVNGVTSTNFTLTSMGPKVLGRSSKIDSPCSGTGEIGWDSSINYTLRDNFSSTMANVPINEAFSGSTVWPRPTSTPGATNSTGGFSDDIFVCAKAGGLSPMPEAPQNPETTTVIDSFHQDWCAGASVSNAWGAACVGAQVQSGTMIRYKDHGNVTVP